MNLALSLPFPRLGRNASWFALTLLPALPFIVHASRDSAFFFNESDFVVTMFTFALLASGLGLTFGLPALIRRLGCRVQKEADLLLPAWILGVFLTQLVAAASPPNEAFDILAFAATAMLMSAIPFGAEFQQRTLPGLLSQPYPRADWWRIKMTTLGVALALQVAIYELTLAALGREYPLVVHFSLIFLGFLAWGSTPWWTLVSRSLLAGLVFSITVPLGVISLLSLLSFSVDPLGVLLYLAGPAYAALAYEGARRRWLGIEAPDSAGSESGVLTLPTFRPASGTSARKSPVLWLLIAKEFRVQTVAIAIGAAALLVTLINLVAPLNAEGNYQFMVRGGALMIAMVGILLAGASAVAEERRMGTLDPQLLLPIARTTQWRLKFLAAAVVAVACAFLVLVNGGGLETREPAEIAVGAGVLVTLFAVSLLASSGSNNALRALLIGVGFSAVAIATTVWAAAFIEGLMRTTDILEPGHVTETLELWRGRVLATDAAGLLPVDSFPAGAVAAIGLIFTLPVIPLVLAILFARLNFLRPAAADRRLMTQFGICYFVLLLAIGGQFGSARWLGRQGSELELMGRVRSFLQWERGLSPAEKLLANQYRRYSPDPLDTSISLPPPPQHDWPMQVPLPLTPDTRRSVIENPALTEELRSLLRAEDAADPRPRRPVVPPVPRAAVPHFNLNPELMRRYGLNPVAVPAEADQPPAADDATEAAPAGAPAQPLLRMDPALMRRYGLLPPAKPPQKTNANEPK